MSMGTDIPLAVLSQRQQSLFSYFKQLFAQVTNPPIDALREEIVTDTTVYVGSDGNLLQDAPENCRVLQIKNPILTGGDLLKLKAMNMPGLQLGHSLAAILQKRLVGAGAGPSFRQLRPGLPGGGQRHHPLGPGHRRKPRGHPLPAGRVCLGAAPHPHEKAHRRLRHSGERRAAGRASFRRPAGLRCPRRKPLPGPRSHRGAHRQGPAGQGLRLRRGRL